MFWSIQRSYHMWKLRCKVEKLIKFLDMNSCRKSNINLNKARLMFAEVVYLWKMIQPWGKFFIFGAYEFSYTVHGDPYDVKNNPLYSDWKDIMLPLVEVMRSKGWDKHLTVGITDIVLG